MSKPIPMHGGPKGMPGGPGMQPRKLDKKTLKRLLSYLKNYKGTIVLVTICILLSAVAGAASSMFLQTLIDDYITPMVGQSSPDFSGFIRALITMAVIYLIGTLSTLIYNRRMVTIAQGTLKTIRDEMFEKMQRLPIRYFDSHTHGDTMSLYTNDTDTLRQMLAQSMGQLIFFCVHRRGGILLYALYQRRSDARCVHIAVLYHADNQESCRQERRVFRSPAEISCRP